jgi:alpha-beta hydrolase superfamily lysophospholipase
MANPEPSKQARRPWYRPIELAKRLFIYAVVIYIVICVFLAAMQTRMIYVGMTYPLTTEKAIHDAKGAGMVPWDHPTPGTTSPQGYVRPDFTKPTARGTIIVFHGNGEFAWMRPEEVTALTQRGFRVFAYEYPGFGGRPGTPSEKAIVPDAQALIRSLAAAGYGPVYVWGQSLGAGVAAAVCADPTVPVHGCALVTAWDNIANVGLSIYPYLPIRLLMIDKYDSIANLQKFPHPICVMRSEKDDLILPALSLNLFAHLPEPKKMILFPDVGHNDWPDDPSLPWWDDALDFIAPKK